MNQRWLLPGLLLTLTMVLTACPGGSGPNPAEYTLTVEFDSAGTGMGAVVSSPEGIDCGDDCDQTYEEGEMVTLTANADAGSEFSGFSENCVADEGTPNVCTVTMDEAKTVTATFNLEGTSDYSLEVSLTGEGSGSVSSDPAGIDCGDTCSASFTSGTSVVLSASADEGSVFTGFSDNCMVGDETAPNVCTVAVNEATTVTANFVLEGSEEYVLNVNTEGEGSGRLTAGSAPDLMINCSDNTGDCTETYSEATTVTLTATANDSDTVFAGFSENCTADETTPNVCTVEVADAASATEVTATFALVTDPQLTVNFIGSGSGLINIGGRNYSGSFTQTFAEGQAINIFAQAGTNSTALAWGGDCATQALNTCSLTMDEDRSISIAFGVDGGYETVNDILVATATPTFSSNDAEEYLNNLDADGNEETTDDVSITGTVDLFSNDLELLYEARGSGVQQVVGIRFPDVEVPAGATILNAVLQLRNRTENPDDALVPEPVFTIRLEDSLTAAEFTASNSNISSRTTTSSEMTWEPGVWTGNNDYDSPNLADMLQAFIDDPSWAEGDKNNGTTLENAVVFILSGNDTTNRRVAYSLGSDEAGSPSGFAPRLIIQYEVAAP